jgi:acylglycerol lipase
VLDGATPVQRLTAPVLSALVPRLGVWGVDADAISTDPAVVRAYEEDPLIDHGKIPVRTLAEMSKAIETFPERLPSLRVPLLSLHGEDDTLVPPSGSELVNELAGSASKRLVTYPGLRHEILNEPEQQTVLDDIRRWLAETGPAPR